MVRRDQLVAIRGVKTRQKEIKLNPAVKTCHLKSL